MTKPKPIIPDADLYAVELFLERGYLVLETMPSSELIGRMLDDLERDDMDAPHMQLN
jgi:hypothetical protein